MWVQRLSDVGALSVPLQDAHALRRVGRSQHCPPDSRPAGPRGVVASLLRRGGVAVRVASGRGAASCAAGAHTWRMINEPTPEHFVASPTAPFPFPLPDAHKSESTKSG